MTERIHPGHRAWQDNPESPDQDDDPGEEPFIPPERDLEFEAWLDDHDQRFDDQYSEANGDIGDGVEPPF